ncbi:hypothetical protein BU25DRAFT_336238 [Macroventuria anomochaeta]|uniref:Uncharacterized protein n=1 Tax=Macroventuria anomochaeta TaxID=301207 RepID=A0ACB6S7V2_9PLEO|nr:uncharacterized protein BU25DRAFT_336238 [Macroventuria anomochaeta]KAF2630043.1 hypothetical protein BU25DRAFT_336238 [Macroventuria anomochaeta]
MALPQRPASRFFAAFYRWSRHTQRPSPCTLSSQNTHLPRCPATFAGLRCYHVTRRVREENQSTHDFMQELQTSAGAVQGDVQAPVEPLLQAVDSAQLKDDVRRLMRKVPASVAVITVAHLDPATDEMVPMGIAVSSLNTVTLDPPTISFNIKQPSQALNAIRAANGRFRVHFLDGQEPSLKIIERFCNGNNPDAYEQRREGLSIDVPQIEDSTPATALLSPRIQGKTVRAAAECTLTQELTVGDHVILVAQVRSLESTNLEDPTIVYVDGTYRRLGPKQPAVDAAQKKALQTTTSRAQERLMAYGWPLIPGEQHRHEYAEGLKSYVKGIPGLRFMNPRDVIKVLEPETKLITKSFGIDLVALVSFCQNGATTNNQSILPEFFGQLSSAKMAKLIDRVKQLVKADKRFLEVGYTDLLRYLDVHIAGASVLPSDLLNPLRAEGLVGPFEPSESLPDAAGPDRNALVLEQAEHLIRKQLSILTDKQILRTPLPAILDRARVPTVDLLHFRENHTRLKVDMCSGFYKDWKVDITGDAAPEEVLVIIRRLVDYMGVGRKQVYRMHMMEETSDMLRNVGVHPLISGVNADYIVSKIRSFYQVPDDFSNLGYRVEDTLQPYFASTVTWEDLESRVRQFVQKFPLRATTWKSRDALAAMGMSGNTTISTPLTETPQTIDDSNLLDMLMAKALKNHYGNGTDEENQAIATFLKDRYKFDVARKTAVVSPEEALKRSSADDLEAARLKHQEETIPIRNVGTRHR